MKTITTRTNSAFSFSCDAKVLTGAISKMISVINMSHSSEFEKKHLVLSHDGNLYVIGISNDTFIAVQVEAEVEDDGIFDVTIATLQGVIKNRSDMEFMFEKGKLNFKATKGKYKGMIDTIAVDDQIITVLNRNLKPTKTSTTLSVDVLDKLRTAMSFSDIKNHFTDDQIVCAIQVGDGQMEISAYDNFHMSHYAADIDSDAEFKLAVPVSVFRLVDKFIKEEDEDASFLMGDKEFKVVGTSYTIVLPPIQVDDNHYSLVREYMASLKNPSTRIQFTNKAIRTVDNMFTLADDESKLVLTVTPEGIVRIALGTDSGSISDAFKLKVQSQEKFQAFIDPRIFGDVFSKVKDSHTVPVAFYSKKNKGVSCAFMVKASIDGAKAFLVGTFSEGEN